MKHALLSVLLSSMVTLSGCMNKATATFDPERDIVRSETFYVEKFPSDTHALNQLIVDDLTARGYSATTGDEGDKPPEDADIMVTYRDKWQWDMTMYMIELTISFRDPSSGAAFASGNSYHTSLTRLSPEEMINEVLTNIFDADAAQAEEGGN
jgi:hypothetical protein